MCTTDNENVGLSPMVRALGPRLIGKVELRSSCGCHEKGKRHVFGGDAVFPKEEGDEAECACKPSYKLFYYKPK